MLPSEIRRKSLAAAFKLDHVIVGIFGRGLLSFCSASSVFGILWNYTP